MSFWEAFLCGIVGGVLSEWWSISIHRGKRLRDFPDEMRTVSYWLFGFIWVVIGGALAGTYELWGDTALNPLLAINVGATAPLIVEGLIRSKDEKPPGGAS